MPLVLLAVGLLAMFIPSYYSLAQTAWMKEDNSHAPIIIALSFWLLWLDRDKIFLTPAKPAVGTARVVLLIGVSAYVVGRSQGVDTLEALAHIVVLAACLLMLQGWSELIKRVAFLNGRGPDPTLKAGEKSAEEELAEILRQREAAKAAPASQ